VRIRIGHLDVRVDGSRLALAGRFDDATSFAELVPRLPAGDLVIDTAQVTFVNSVGMREWVRLVRALRERGSRVTLECVAEPVMSAMNLVRELASAVTVTSFHAPYACPGCGAEPRQLVDAVMHAARLRRCEAPPLPCPECGVEMELGDFPERYLSIFKP
jgi:anti-anti-sigma regulatory factor